jgi:hypothetical protein
MPLFFAVPAYICLVSSPRLRALSLSFGVWTRMCQSFFDPTQPLGDLITTSINYFITIYTTRHKISSEYLLLFLFWHVCVVFLRARKCVGTLEMAEEGASEVTGPVRRILLISAGGSHSVALLCKLLTFPFFFTFLHFLSS